MIGCPPSRALACSGEGLSKSRGCWDQSNRRGQDKSRNVRPVGREENSSNSGDFAHIVLSRCTLPTSPNRLHCSLFRTLRRRP